MRVSKVRGGEGVFGMGDVGSRGSRCLSFRRLRRRRWCCPEVLQGGSGLRLRIVERQEFQEFRHQNAPIFTHTFVISKIHKIHQNKK